MYYCPPGYQDDIATMICTTNKGLEMRSSEIHELANPKEKSDPHVAVYKCTFIVKYRSEKNKEEHKARFRQPIKCKGFLNKLLTMLNLLLRRMFLY